MKTKLRFFAFVVVGALCGITANAGVNDGTVAGRFSSVSIADSSGTCSLSNASGPQVVSNCTVSLNVMDAGTLWVHTGSNLDGVTNASSLDAGVLSVAGASTLTGTVTGGGQIRATTAAIAGYGSFNYVQLNGSATGAPVTLQPVGGDSNVSFALQPLGTGFVSSSGGFKPLFQTLNTCASGFEGLISLDATSGVATAHRTRACMCTSNGSSTYTWQNIVSGTVGTATTCSD